MMPCYASEEEWEQPGSLTWVAVGEQRADGQQDLGHRQRRAPLVLQNVQADAAVAVDVAVVDARTEGDLQRSAGGALAAAGVGGEAERLYGRSAYWGAVRCIAAAHGGLGDSFKGCIMPGKRFRNRRERAACRRAACSACWMAHLWRLEGIVRREVDVQEENSTGVGRACDTLDGGGSGKALRASRNGPRRKTGPQACYSALIKHVER